MTADFTLYAIRVFVSDWDRAMEFYRDTLGMEVRFEDAAMGWAQFATGECSLAVERVDPKDPDAPRLIGRFVGASLLVEDINATYLTLVDRGVPFQGQPEPQPWGGVLAHFRDPDGNRLTLLGNT